MIQDLETKERIQILQDNYIGHLGFIYRQKPFVIPITYYYNDANNSIISYAMEGHKIEAMRKNTEVAFEVNDIKSVSKWRSVMVHGTYEELSGTDAKFNLHQFADGVKSIINRKEKKHLQFINEFSSKLESERHPIVYRINIEGMTAKFRVD